MRRLLLNLAWPAFAALGLVGVCGSVWLSLTNGAAAIILPALFWSLLTLPLGMLLVKQALYAPTILQRLILVSVVITGSVLITDWPFSLAVRLSRSAMHRASIAVTDAPLEQRSFLGLFPVRAVERRGEVVAFWTDLNPAGRSGLVLSRSGALPFNLWSQRSLGDGWYFIVED